MLPPAARPAAPVSAADAGDPAMRKAHVLG